jgi:CRISPR-associated protein Cmr2
VLELWKSEAGSSDRLKNFIQEKRQALRTPNFPNIFVAKIPADVDAGKLAQEVEKKIRATWEEIAGEVLIFLGKQKLTVSASDRFKAQINSANFPSVAWQVTPFADNWPATYKQNARDLDGVRQTRNFAAAAFTGWNKHVNGSDLKKDMLTGALEAVADGGAWFDRAPADGGIKQRLKDQLLFSAPTLIKRFWDLACLQPKHGFHFDKVANTHDIAAGEPTNDSADAEPDSDDENKYFAVLMFDGDSVGQWISGEKTGAQEEQFHSKFSAELSKFALQEVHAAVEANNGFLIYAGGDDVLALLPAGNALKCAQELRDAYRKTLNEFKAADDGSTTPDGSAGIAIAHCMTPLQDVVRAAQMAEKRKGGVGRAAVCMTLIKRSGEILEWDSKWDWQPVELHNELAAAMSNSDASAKLPHRIIELLTPYLSKTTPLCKVVTVSGFDPVCVAQKEIEHVFERQCPDEATAIKLRNLFTTYAKAVEAYDKDTDFILNKLIGLCTAAAFAYREKKS